VVIFYTDHGYQLPRAKQFCYEEGVKVPLIISWPRGKEYLELGGKRREDLVNCIDLAAVTLGLAEIPVPGYMEGKDLFHEDYEERPFVVSARDRCDYTVEQIRSVRSSKYRYIKNYKTDRPILQPQYRDHYATMVNYKELYEQGKLNDVQSWGYAKRVPEELYDMEKDPHQIYNLAANPDFEGVLDDHREYLQEWISETGDKGQRPEAEASLRDVYKRWKEKCVNPEFNKVKN
ncbi:MAG: sulfatase-like hydrolase/transferase, partial [Lentisphaeraceae bacterium]|nr:sulfatase-like hydrolase/transferase [Lentisphaeraceae bacterium]